MESTLFRLIIAVGAIWLGEKFIEMTQVSSDAAKVLKVCLIILAVAYFVFGN